MSDTATKHNVDIRLQGQDVDRTRILLGETDLVQELCITELTIKARAGAVNEAHVVIQNPQLEADDVPATIEYEIAGKRYLLVDPERCEVKPR